MCECFGIKLPICLRRELYFVAEIALHSNYIVTMKCERCEEDEATIECMLCGDKEGVCFLIHMILTASFVHPRQLSFCHSFCEVVHVLEKA